MHDPFSHEDMEIVSEQTLHQGFLRLKRLNLRHRLFNGGWSEEFQREVMLRDHAVGVLLYDPSQEELVLVRQFRVGMATEPQSPWLLEIVAGMVGAGEALEEVAVRESQEEADLTPSNMLRICDYYNSPGSTNEKITLYLGRVDATIASGIHGLNSEHEDIEVVRLPLQEALMMLESGGINNAMTIIALQWLQLKMPHVRRQWGLTDAS